jgi:hypothetical protein
MPKALFTRQLDEAALAYWKAPGRLDPNGVLRRQYAEALLHVAEALMISPSVTFKVYGENVVLACLVRFFGLPAVETLLEEGSIEFILWRNNVASVQADDLIRQGINPIAAMGTFQTTVHRDPEASCLSGLNWLNGVVHLDRSQKRSLVRRAVKRMSLTPENAPSEVVEATMKAVHAGAFGETDSESLIANRSTILTAASRLFEASIIAERELDLHESADTWDAVRQIADEVNSASHIPAVVESILRDEEIPSIQSLVAAGTLTPSDILMLRHRRETSEFREWLWTRPDPSDAGDVLEAYRRIVMKNIQGSETPYLGHARIIALSVLGAVAGDAAAQAIGAGPIGGIIGAAAASFAANTAVATILGEGDKLIDRIFQHNPRRFALLLRDTLFSKNYAPLETV